jgi:group I intron endonuclease
MAEYIVYKHTCPNGKVYIGITRNNPLARWNGGHGYRNNKHFYNAICKYGWENIQHEILFDDLTKEEAEQKEIELIALHRSNNAKYGYNHENGGNSTGKMSEETKHKISESLKGIERGAMSEETRLKVSRSRKGKCVGEQHPMFQKKMSEETKKKLSEKLKGRKISAETLQKRNITQGKRCMCCETKIVYCSIKDASQDTGINEGTICGVCKGKRKTAGGYHWEYVR